MEGTRDDGGRTGTAMDVMGMDVGADEKVIVVPPGSEAVAVATAAAFAVSAALFALFSRIQSYVVMPLHRSMIWSPSRSLNAMQTGKRNSR